MQKSGEVFVTGSVLRNSLFCQLAVVRGCPCASLHSESQSPGIRGRCHVGIRHGHVSHMEARCGHCQAFLSLTPGAGTSPPPSRRPSPDRPQPQGAEETLPVTWSSGLSLTHHPNPHSVLWVNVMGVQSQADFSDPPSNVTGLRGGPQSTASPWKTALTRSTLNSSQPMGIGLGHRR